MTIIIWCCLLLSVILIASFAYMMISRPLRSLLLQEHVYLGFTEISSISDADLQSSEVVESEAIENSEQNISNFCDVSSAPDTIQKNIDTSSKVEK